MCPGCKPLCPSYAPAGKPSSFHSVMQCSTVFRISQYHYANQQLCGRSSSWSALSLSTTVIRTACFQPGSRCIAILPRLPAVQLIVYNDIVRAVDKGQVVPLVLLDLSSAFDTVDHDCLLSVFQRRFSVDGDAMTWFRSYLDDRTRTFVAGEDHHGPLPVNCSVPQGSI